MCGRYVQGMNAEELDEFIGADLRADNLPPASWNISPTQQVPILLEDHKQVGVRRLESARWALTPFWSKTLETRTPLFNARIETVLEKPSFAASVKNRRCVLPASGYYEWTGPKDARVPHYIHAAQPILFAGLSSWWRNPDAPNGAEWVLTATMLTMDSYGPMEQIHHRIPVFMTDQLKDDWLSPTIHADERLLNAAVEQSMAVGTTLSERTVASLKGDGPELIASSH